MVTLANMDVDLLERAVDAAPGDELVVRKDQLYPMLSAIRRGQNAERLLINLGSLATVAGMSMRVQPGYNSPPPTQAP